MIVDPGCALPRIHAFLCPFDKLRIGEIIPY